MYNIKTLLAAASVAVAFAAGVGGAQAAPWDQNMRDHRVTDTARHERPLVVRARVLDALRLHHYRMIGDPMFIRGHYVVKSHDRFGRAVFVEVNPYTGAFIGEFRA